MDGRIRLCAALEIRTLRSLFGWTWDAMTKERKPFYYRLQYHKWHCVAHNALWSGNGTAQRAMGMGKDGEREESPQGGQDDEAHP